MKSVPIANKLNGVCHNALMVNNFIDFLNVPPWNCAIQTYNDG